MYEQNLEIKQQIQKKISRISPNDTYTDQDIQNKSFMDLKNNPYDKIKNCKNPIERLEKLKKQIQNSDFQNGKLQTGTILHQQNSVKLRETQLNYVRRKNVEKIVEKQIMDFDQFKLLNQQNLHNKGHQFNFLRKITFKLISKIATALFQSLLSFVACVIYVVSTYYEEKQDEGFYRVVEIIISSLFLVDYIASLISKKNKLKFIKNPMSIIDLVTIIPVFISLFSQDSNISSITKFVGIVRVLRAFRILRLYRLFNRVKQSQRGGQAQEQSEVKRKIIIISCTIVAIVFIAAGIIHAFTRLDIGFDINTPDDELKFDTAFYFMVVTVTTVGYGDIAPGSLFAQVLIGIFMIAMIILISKQTSELNELIQYSSKYQKTYNGKLNHVVVTGAVNSNNLYRFLKEFYHPDHSVQEQIPVLIVQNKEPSENIISLIQNPKYDHLVQYLKGDIFTQEILEKAKIHDKTTVIILADQFTVDSKDDDLNALLTTCVVNQYNSNTKIYAQIVDPNMQFHSWADYDICMSTISYKMGIIAGNIFNQGYSTLMSNLVLSSSVPMKVKKQLPLYALEYTSGMSHEIYQIQFSQDINKIFVGKPFIDAVQIIYQSTGILLIGIQSKNQEESKFYNLFEIFLNPVNYLIKASDAAIVIAKNLDEAKNLWNLNQKYVEELIIQKDSSRPSKVEDSQQVYKSHQSMDQFILTEEEVNVLQELKVEKYPEQSEIFTSNIPSEIYFFETDIRGQLKNHIIVIGLPKQFEQIIESIRYYSNLHILFISNAVPDETWNQLKNKHKNIFYGISSLCNIEDLLRAGIQDCFHTVILSWAEQNSTIFDSTILPIVRLMEENFQKIKFTVELIDEDNLRNMNYGPQSSLGISNVTPYLYPRFSSSQAFLSSTIDYIMAQAYHTNLIIDIIGKLISSNPQPNIQGITQNSKIKRVLIPESFNDIQIKYGDVFSYLVGLQVPVIPIAIYRQQNFEKNQLPYVITNPLNTSPIIPGDYIIVIGDFMVNELEINLNQMEIIQKQNLSMHASDGKQQSQLENLKNLSKNFLGNDIQTVVNQILEEDKQSDYFELTDDDQKTMQDYNQQLQQLLERHQKLIDLNQKQKKTQQ